MRIDLHLHEDEPPGDQTLLAAILTLIAKADTIMATLADLQAAVAAETTVEQSVITLLQQLSADLQAAQAAGDGTAIQSVIDTINANAAALSAAVAANTPAASTATPPAGGPAPADGTAPAS